MRRGPAEVGGVGEVGGGQHVQPGQHLAGRAGPRLHHRAEAGRHPQRALHDRVGDGAGRAARPAGRRRPRGRRTPGPRAARTRCSPRRTPAAAPCGRAAGRCRRGRRRRPPGRRAGRAAGPAGRGAGGRAAAGDGLRPGRTGSGHGGRRYEARPHAVRAGPRLRSPCHVPPPDAAARPPRAERVERRRAACRARPRTCPLTELGPRPGRRGRRRAGPPRARARCSPATCSAPCRPPSTARRRPGCRSRRPRRCGSRATASSRAGRRASCGTSSTGPIRTGRRPAARAWPSCTAGWRPSSRTSCAEPPADVIALVTHGDTIRAVQAVVAGLGPGRDAGGHPAQRHGHPAARSSRDRRAR